MKDEAAVTKREASPEDILRDLVTGKRSEVPPGGIVGVSVTYRSSPHRITLGVSAGPVEISEEGTVRIAIRFDELSMTIDGVPFGSGPRTWRFRAPSDVPNKARPTPPPTVRSVSALRAQSLIIGGADGVRTDGEAKRRSTGS